MINKIKFNLSKDDNESQIRSQLATQYPLKKDPVLTRPRTYYDTFDWRLFDQSLILLSFHDGLILREMGQEDILCRFDGRHTPGFIWDFPKGRLEQYLKPIIKMRRLLKLVELVSHTVPYRVLNQDEKTVVRLYFETIRTRSKKNPVTIGTKLCLMPVKGYPKHATRVKSQIEQLGFLPSNNEDVFFQALHEAGLEPGSYSSKLRLDLTPDMRADTATLIIFRFLLNIIKANQPKIKQDIDTEILHDYRVAVRRTRSALVWDKNIFARDTLALFKKDLSFVGKLSNELRDLDVYLLNKAKYKTMLPKVLRDDLDPMFDYLAKQRTASFRNFVRSLQSQKYRKIMQNWEAFLNETQHDTYLGPAASLSVLKLASKRIYKQYKDVVKAGNRILEDSDDEKLHRLRIQCKKLRYLIQFFADLYPPEKIIALTEQLRNLQDMLGNFNDLSVQVAYLLGVAKDMPANLSQLNRALVAMGSLIGKLETKRKSIKKSFAKTFSQFSSSQNRKLFRALFAQHSKQVIP